MARSSIFIIPDTSKKSTENTPSISFDAVTNFTPTRRRKVSKSPVSDGSYISELLSDEGGRVVMEAYVSSHPIALDSNNLIDSKNADTRAQAGYLALKSLYDSKNTVNIQYRFDRDLSSYMLTNFEPIVLPSDGIGFKLEFDEVRFSTEKRVQLSLNMSDDKAKDAAKSTNGGLEGKQEATEKEGSLLIEALKSPFVLIETEGL